MIEYLIGNVFTSPDGGLIVESGGVGYALACSSNAINRLGGKQEAVKVYTILSFTEAGLNLYGFYDVQERDMFRQLTTVPKVGPKAALSLLSVFEPRELSYIIAAGDTSALSKAGGVGKKLAESIAFTLKNKFSNAQTGGNAQDLFYTEELGDSKTEAVLALTSLGFDRSIAVKTVNSIYTEEMTVQSLISAALLRIGG